LEGACIQLLPSPISTRLYDTYPETVKVSHDGKDYGDGQTQGRGKRGKRTQQDQKKSCGSQVTSGRAENCCAKDRARPARKTNAHCRQGRPDERLSQNNPTVEVQNVNEKSRRQSEQQRASQDSSTEDRTGITLRRELSPRR
jgi:hypothetical protein